MRMRNSAFIVVLFIGLFLAAPAAQAQVFVPEKGSSWGVSVDATPRWEAMRLLERFVEDDVDLSGRDLRVGVVRGKAVEGDWGVSFVWASIDKGSSIKSNSTYSYCMNENCSEVGVGNRFYFVDASFVGLEVHKYIPFVTINDRVQVGVNLGGGALWPRGTAEKHEVRPQVTIRKDGGFDLRAITEVSRVSARDVFKDRVGTAILPTARVEGVLGIVVTDNLKLKLASGVNFPSQHRVTVGAVWLF